MEGGGNYQWPVERLGEGSDEPDALCSASITVGIPGTTVTPTPEPSPTPESTPIPESSSEPVPSPMPEPTPTPTSTPTPVASSGTDSATSSSNLEQFDNKIELVFNALGSALEEYQDYCLDNSQDNLKLQKTLDYYHAYLGYFDELVLLTSSNLGSGSPTSLPSLTLITEDGETNEPNTPQLLQTQFRQSIINVEYYLKSAVVRYRNYLVGGKVYTTTLATSGEHYNLYQSSLDNMIGLCGQL